MEIFWAIALSVMLTVYVVMDGFDFGAGIIHLFFAKKEEDKKKIVGSIGPFWDGNEVWLIAGGGILFFAFPTLYASAFSGFYLPLIMVLWLLIFRAIGLELREQLHNEMWYKVWDRAFGIASLLLALFFGIALGNVVRGVNLGGAIDGVDTLESNYFFSNLWSDNFSPFHETPGVIDWFTITIGILAVLTLTIHGAAWIRFKTRSSINDKLTSFIKKGSVILAIITIGTVFLWTIVKPHALDNFGSKPYLIFFPILVFVSLFGLIFTKPTAKDGRFFTYSTIYIVASLLSTVASVFPVLLHSTNPNNPSLTIYNTQAGEYGLQVGAMWWIFAFIFVVGYFVLVHRIFRGKTDDITYDH